MSDSGCLTVGVDRGTSAFRRTKNYPRDLSCGGLLARTEKIFRGLVCVLPVFRRPRRTVSQEGTETLCRY